LAVPAVTLLSGGKDCENCECRSSHCRPLLPILFSVCCDRQWGILTTIQEALQIGGIGRFTTPVTTTMPWEDMTQSPLCSSVKECGAKHAYNFVFPKSSFRIRRTTFSMQFVSHFSPNQQQQPCLPQFNSIFGRPPLSSSTSSLPSQN